ncbi:hypothetical protein HMPREF3239_08740 [Staphylococcus sp. HMSC34C02]|nr:hypothetical protein HMPREF3239_08740 [Staphylococcus sp. HMSC34C02]OLF25077.1 hypothetical protein BSZ10_12615 [Staphylococcus aureus]
MVGRSFLLALVQILPSPLFLDWNDDRFSLFFMVYVLNATLIYWHELTIICAQGYYLFKLL